MAIYRLMSCYATTIFHVLLLKNLPMSIYAIGDVQGCRRQLDSLVSRIQSTSPDPTLIFVGDLVNRGPDSVATLRRVRQLGTTAKVVLGNHDLNLLGLANGVRKPHRSDTLQQVMDAPDRDELLDWLRHQPLALFENGHLFVHAGVVPQWSAEQTITLAHEVEAVLRGPDWLGFLREMYGNTPAKWNDSLRGVERLRCIVNALTRIRHCQADGTIDFTTSEVGVSSRPDLIPWFDVPGRKTENVTVVFGHWSTLGLTVRDNLIGLDTGCVWGGRLTAVRIEDRAEDREIFQVDCPEYQKPG
jgi:bis(5'-nucleosyl)-tetraphosphatase (symmetrical)